MKYSLAALLAVASTASAHYTLPELTVKGVKTGQWAYVRKTSNYQSNGPVTDVTSNAIRCYELSPGTGSKTYTVNAGDTVGFTAATSISHPGTLQFYLAKVPSGKTAATWDGSGTEWFKIYSQGPSFSGGQLTWPSNGKTEVDVTLPKSLPSGEYLLRGEHIALHSAGSAGGAQFYLSCAQLKVENGGNGSPGPKVAFPGAYKATDPGIMINIYYPVPTSYTAPGPAVWSG
ncbi:fungal cellulose binding domain containing protein [Pyrenophora tritici-repentis]|uniref:lytic cellulose monooxygenase (C4-dehydrogenating) n=2 Tax=Pyrenophora tritici-repentis TaxID=45151 RepID=A0A2W1E3J6_9PLEO|nr:fungal cellulose binding domain containing protein [Pyrenophora tritici-repentis Pt-1C-BFP]KAA8615079.1 Fungal cellulose binding domain-containing protein [Pyrenophora tritici-repentis]EDU50404.1 fungal cellulose binding domain containing protein [Pyrenophora tritici-repentis Pt-1C-BFP]KAF7444899.1 Fungal cellulose binding domain containing protein [Pyrenophora tritici-repentis]KAF7564431.1 Glyco-hydro-61 multi-domain protein [Pyrenophora tritici-repentis]KAG9379139.1 Fungal cellulose bindi